MNDYESKKQARIDRYKKRAEKTKLQAEQNSKRATDMLDVLPLGQPILVGHHSEKKHRALLKRSDTAMRKASEEYEKAKHYQQKAKAAEGSIAISSDDPEALIKLKEKLTHLENERDTKKLANAKLRKLGKVRGTPASEFFDKLHEQFSKEEIQHFIEDFRHAPNFCYSTYVFQNLGANIRQVKKRIEAMEKKSTASSKSTETKHDNFISFSINECPNDNRIRIIFDEKPPREICRILRSRGFIWSPTNIAWQRHLNEQGRWAAEFAAKEINKLMAEGQ